MLLTTSIKARLKITLNDIRSAGSFSAALDEVTAEHDDLSSGVIGPEFSTSGPGPGWSINHTEKDFVERALSEDYGALGYVAEDGRLAQMRDNEIVWTDESVIELECPEAQDVFDYPEDFEKMVHLVKEHQLLTDLGAWRQLVMDIRTAADSVSDIDLTAWQED